ncbi:hypothetical protein IWX65_003645, partial [Arthrobacter sp. CAN_A214]
GGRGEGAPRLSAPPCSARLHPPGARWLGVLRGDTAGAPRLFALPCSARLHPPGARWLGVLRGDTAGAPRLPGWGVRVSPSSPVRCAGGAMKALGRSRPPSSPVTGGRVMKAVGKRSRLPAEPRSSTKDRGGHSGQPLPHLTARSCTPGQRQRGTRTPSEHSPGTRAHEAGQAPARARPTSKNRAEVEGPGPRPRDRGTAASRQPARATRR